MQSIHLGCDCDVQAVMILIFACSPGSTCKDGKGGGELAARSFYYQLECISELCTYTDMPNTVTLHVVWKGLPSQVSIPHDTLQANSLATHLTCQLLMQYGVAHVVCICSIGCACMQYLTDVAMLVQSPEMESHRTLRAITVLGVFEEMLPARAASLSSSKVVCSRAL